MKILLDECITKRLKPYLSKFEIFPVSEMRWNGIKNGALLVLCFQNQFDIFLTIDKDLTYQQNIKNLDLTVVVLNSTSSKIEELVLFIPAFISKIQKFERGKFYIIDKQ